MTPEERFWTHVDRSGGLDACWPWTGAVNIPRGGYGNVKVRNDDGTRRTASAHRVAWQYASGEELSPNVVLCHACDNPPCCNPRHLIRGTQTDNVIDMVDKGRHFRHGQTHCKRGHEFTSENTYLRVAHNGVWRTCRECQRQRRKKRAN